ncbi:NAD(P)-binding protein [Aureobasidium pullulans]|nr:NAD(P)-binding protein [Aureobasidium pullulans]
MSSQYQSVHLKARPTSEIVAGETFEVKSNAAPKESDLKDGQVIFRSLYLSLDPAMRGWLNGMSSTDVKIQDTRSYVPPVQIGEIMRGVAIGTVEASKSDKFPVGTLATGFVGWTELAVVEEKALERVDLPSNGRTTDALGVLGMTGLTAYFGIIEVGQVKEGDFVVVSGAAGATGSVVAQIAKLKGAKFHG